MEDHHEKGTKDMTASALHETNKIDSADAEKETISPTKSCPFRSSVADIS